MEGKIHEYNYRELINKYKELDNRLSEIPYKQFEALCDKINDNQEFSDEVVEYIFNDMKSNKEYREDVIMHMVFGAHQIPEKFLNMFCIEEKEELKTLLKECEKNIKPSKNIIATGDKLNKGREKWGNIIKSYIEKKKDEGRGRDVATLNAWDNLKRNPDIPCSSMVVVKYFGSYNDKMTKWDSVLKYFGTTFNALEKI